MSASPPDDLPAPPSEMSATDDEAQILRARLAHRERQIEAIRAISETLFSHDSIDAMLHQTLQIAMDILGAGVGIVQLHDAARDVLVVRHALGPRTETLRGLAMPTDQGIGGRVFRSGQAHVTLDARSDPDFNHAASARVGFTARAVATAPIKRRNQAPIGIIQMVDFEALYDARDLETLEIIASQAAIAIDDSEREVQARKAAMISFIGDLSHDIKNMLTPIQTGMWTLDPMLRQMFGDLEIACKSLPDEQRASIEAATKLTRGEYEWMLQNALDSADRVQNRTKEIADAVKGVSSPPRFERGDFNDACEDAVSALRLVAHDAQVDLQLDLDSSLAAVEFDRKQIDTALYNLINNAIAETPEDGIIVVRTRQLASDQGRFLVEIADTGGGMPDEVREKLFTDEAVSTKIGGTGLGTRIVGDIIKRHHGDISVQSAVGEGTTFTILLPVRQN